MQILAHRAWVLTEMDMKMMWIIYYGLHSHTISTQLKPNKSFWIKMFSALSITIIETPYEDISCGRMALPQQTTGELENLCKVALTPFCCWFFFEFVINLYTIEDKCIPLHACTGPNAKTQKRSKKLLNTTIKSDSCRYSQIQRESEWIYSAYFDMVQGLFGCSKIIWGNLKLLQNIREHWSDKCSICCLHCLLFQFLYFLLCVKHCRFRN